MKHKKQNSSINNKIYTNSVTPLHKTPHITDNSNNESNDNNDDNAADNNNNNKLHIRNINIVFSEPNSKSLKQEASESKSPKVIFYNSNNKGVDKDNANHIQKSNNKLLFSFQLNNNSHISQQKEVELITNLDPIYLPEIPYTVLILSKISKNINIVNRDFLQKRNAILSNNSFSSIVSFNDKKPHSHKIECNYQKRIIDHYTSIENQYNFLYMSLDMKEKTSLYKILLSSDTAEIAKSNASHLCHLYDKKTFIEMFSYRHVDAAEISFDYYRLFESNGDSFFRAFMFSYIEYLLINKLQKELLAMFIDIFRLTDFNEYVYKLINLKDSMMFFSIMTDLIESNQFDEAYHLFVLSYINPITKQTVDDLLVIYMKWCLFALQYDDLYDKEGNDGKDMKKKQKKTKIVRNTFRNYNILKPYMEPSIIVFESVTHLFNVNLKIYWIEGDNRNSSIELCEFNGNSSKCNSNSNSNVNINNNSNSNNESNKIMTINLGYFYTGYHCVYIDTELANNEIFETINTKFVMNPQRVKALEGLQLCSKCNQSKTVFFDKLDKGICYECLMTGVNFLLIQRAKFYVQDAFLNLEYYCNTLYFNDKTVSISNNDLLVISNQTIPQIMSGIIENMCFSCFNQFDPSEILQLQCACRYCRPCLLFKLKQVTDRKMVLNKYEMLHLKVGFCLCRGTINLREVLQMLNEPFVEETSNARQRLTQIALTVCSYCRNVIIEENKLKPGENKPKKPMIRFRIKNEFDADLIPGIDYYDQEHLICRKCINKIGTMEINRKRKVYYDKDNSSQLNNELEDKDDNDKIDNRNKDNKEKNQNKNADDIIIHCNICDLDHNIDAKDFEIKRETICCEKQCIII